MLLCHGNTTPPTNWLSTGPGEARGVRKEEKTSVEYGLEYSDSSASDSDTYSLIYITSSSQHQWPHPIVSCEPNDKEHDKKCNRNDEDA